METKDMGTDSGNELNSKTTDKSWHNVQKFNFEVSHFFSIFSYSLKQQTGHQSFHKSPIRPPEMPGQSGTWSGTAWSPTDGKKWDGFSWHWGSEALPPSEVAGIPKGSWEMETFLMLLLKYFYIYTGGIIHSQLWLASPWKRREIKLCWINLNSEVKKKKEITKSLTVHCPFHSFEYKIQNVQFAYMNTSLK